MKNKVICLIIVSLVYIFTSSCSSQGMGEEPLPDLGTIRIGYIPILAFTPTYVAADKGYFEEQGLKVELLSFPAASYMMPLLATGELDFGAGQFGTETLNAINQGLDVKVVGGHTQQRSGHGSFPFVVRKDLFDSGTIIQPADLKGAKIALNVERGIAEVFAAKVLENGGLTLDDVEIVTMPFPDMGVAFSNQAIDGAILAQPLAGKAIKDGLVVILLDGDEIFEGGQTGVLYFGKRLLDPDNREVGIRLLVAYQKAVRDLYGDGWSSDENLEICSKYTSVAVPAIKNGVSNYHDPNGKINFTFIEYLMGYYIDHGYTELSGPLPMSQIIDTSYMEKAIDRIGEFKE